MHKKSGIIMPYKFHTHTIVSPPTYFKVSRLCRFLIFALSAFVIAQNAVAQDSLLVKGKLLVHVLSPLDAYYNAIADDTTDLSAQAQQEFDWLKSQGCKKVEKMAKFSESRLVKYFVINYDTSIVIDTIRNRLAQNSLIDTSIFVVRRTEEYYGCYENAYSNEYTSDLAYNTNNSWHVWTADQYIDADMSVTDAWEFTRSAPSVVTLVDAGHRWWICDADLPKTIWRDFDEQVIEGWWPENHIWSQEPPENCYCYDCDVFRVGLTGKIIT
jgi:hypothetical protein